VYGVPKDIALAWAIAYHVTSFVPVTVLGMIYSIRMGLHFGDIKKTNAANG
jgi:hypothetical protein